MTFSDQKVIDFVNANFVAVWESVAPVSIAVFDLGNGKQVRGAYNGNIALYLCDPNGRVLDILPALQTPRITLDRLVQDLALWKRAQPLDEAARERAVRTHHAEIAGPPAPQPIAPAPDPLTRMKGKSADVVVAAPPPPAASVALDRLPRKSKAVVEPNRDLAALLRAEEKSKATVEPIRKMVKKSDAAPEPPPREIDRTLVVVAGGLKRYMERIHPFLAQAPLRTPDECKQYVFEEVLGEKLEGRSDIFVTDDPVSIMVHDK